MSVDILVARHGSFQNQGPDIDPNILRSTLSGLPEMGP